MSVMSKRNKHIGKKKTEIKIGCFVQKIYFNDGNHFMSQIGPYFSTPAYGKYENADICW